MKLHKIYVISILIIFIISLYITIIFYTGSSTPSIMKGYGNKTESVGVLLDRIQWANHYPVRTNMFFRYALYSVVISFFASVIYEKEISVQNNLQCVIIIWMLLLGFHSFFNHHADKFSSYFIDNNLNYIRSKLNIKSNIDNLSENYKRFSSNDDCATFIYKYR